MTDRIKQVLAFILVALPAVTAFAGSTSVKLHVDVAVPDSCVLSNIGASYDGDSSTMSGQLDTRCSIGTPVHASLTTSRFPAFSTASFTELQGIDLATETGPIKAALKVLDEEGNVKAEEESWDFAGGDGGGKWTLLKYHIKRGKITASGNAPSPIYAFIAF